MTKHSHTVVWMDHRAARILSLPWEGTTRLIPAHDRHSHLHHKANTIGDGHALTDVAYFEDVANALLDAREILLTGPADAKRYLQHFIERHTPALAKRIVAVETLDHPTDGELADFARHRFSALDRMRPQLG
jgi:hypothetical protein